MVEHTSTESTDPPASISAKRERVEEIIEVLERGEVSLERAKELRDEGRALLADLEDDLDVGDGTISELES
jgi:exodeoxyribonuclease VII small subunit